MTKKFSLHKKLDKNEKIVEKLLMKVSDIYLKKYFGKFNSEVVLTRIKHFDRTFETSEVYSNKWHLDSDLGFRQCKVFLLLHDVGINDGPLIYLSRVNTKKYWSKISDRNSFESFRNMFVFPEQEKFIGKKGDILILNTSLCAHRASIPDNIRDMLVMTFVSK